MAKVEPTSGRAFWTGFWAGFGRFMAAFVVIFVVAAIFGDTSAASFDSATMGLVFAAICSAIYGLGSGEDAVRHWREQVGE